MINIVTHLKSKLLADKTFTIGLVPRKVKTAKDKAYDREFADQYDSYEIYERQQDYSMGISTIEFFDRGSFERKFIKTVELSQTPPTPTKRYGLKGITPYGRKMVTCGAILLEEKFTKKQIGFGTATLPELPHHQMVILQKNWGDLVRRFFQEQKRHFERLGVPFIYCGVTEIQESRFINTGTFALHLHWAYYCRRGSGAFFISAAKLRSLWFSCISSVLRKHGEELRFMKDDFNASINCTLVQKSCAGYLGKYMSKGAKALESLPDECLEQLPKQWWFASMQLKRAFKKSIITLDGEMVTELFYNINACMQSGTVVWAKYVEIPDELDEGKYRKIGMVGVFSDAVYEHYKQNKRRVVDIWDGLVI